MKCKHGVTMPTIRGKGVDLLRGVPDCCLPDILADLSSDPDSVDAAEVVRTVMRIRGIEA